MLTLLFFAFLSGLVTIAAPCIWPILPIVLSASATGGHRRPLGIVVGLVASFTFVTLALASIVRALPIDPESFRLFAVVIIGMLGVSLLVPAIGSRIEVMVSRISSKFGGVRSKGEGFGGGVVTGVAIGIVWSPCAGPILAAVATLAATRAVSIESVFVTIAFGIGIAIPLFLFATLGRRLFVTNQLLRKYTRRIQQVFGAIMILAAFMIWSGYDKTLQTKLLDVFPNYGSFLNRFEDRSEVETALDDLRKNNVNNNQRNDMKQENVSSRLPVIGVAPEFRGISNWLNVDGKPIAITELRGKVVLVDFWTYSCINCIRTLPYVTGWYEKYKDNGFVVVGVHTPEFVFEHKTENVVSAMRRYGINYPVAQDNDYETWQAYSNRYWPAHYLVDAEGRVRYVHFGEGKYDVTEEAIQALLDEAGMLVEKKKKLSIEVEGTTRGQTAETYLGFARMERFVSPEIVTPIVQKYSIPESVPLHSFAFGGAWNVDRERSVSHDENSSIELRFRGNKVFLVIGPPDGRTGTARVFLDGSVIGESSGADVHNGVVLIDAERLYELVDFHDDGGDHTLRLEFDIPGTAVYAFTFG